jgi:hypothetical protein
MGKMIERRQRWELGRGEKRVGGRGPGGLQDRKELACGIFTTMWHDVGGGVGELGRGEKGMDRADRQTYRRHTGARM